MPAGISIQLQPASPIVAGETTPPQGAYLLLSSLRIFSSAGTHQWGSRDRGNEQPAAGGEAHPHHRNPSGGNRWG